MSRFLVRYRAATKVVREGLQRLILRRRIVRSDRKLDRRPDEVLVDFTGSHTIPSRRLPARVIPIIDPWQYHRNLFVQIIEFFERHQIKYLRFPHLSGGQQKIALHQSDWPRAISGLAETEFVRFVIPCSKPRHILDRELIPNGLTFDYASSSCVSILTPAVTVLSDKRVSRYGLELGVILEKWIETDNGDTVAPFWNPIANRLPKVAWQSREPQTAERDVDLSSPSISEVSFDIDVVFTWVDGTDSAWRRRKQEALARHEGSALIEDATATLRFIDHDELKYALRSIERYAPWVRHIWLVTDNQVPAWLNTDHPRITVVDHTAIAPPSAKLPTYNSHAIEANLHRIDGLAEHFLYFNDDMFLSSFVSPEVFYSANGLSHIFFSKETIGYGDAVEGEAAPDAAGKNARKLIGEEFKVRLSRKLYHVPYSLRRSISYEIENRWPAIIDATRDSTFRSTTDVAPAGSLHLNYAFVTGRAVDRFIRYRYVNIRAADARAELERVFLDRFSLQAFCLNEAAGPLSAEEVDANVRRILEKLFPDVSTFEVAGELD